MAASLTPCSSLPFHATDISNLPPSLLAVGSLARAALESEGEEERGGSGSGAAAALRSRLVSLRGRLVSARAERWSRLRALAACCT